MGTNLGVEINADKVLEMFKHFSPAQAEAAWRRTLRKTGNYMKTLVGREVSKAKQIPLKVLRDRLNFYLKSPSTAKVWLGLNPIEAHRLAYGSGAKQRGNGVKAGRHHFSGGWLMPVHAKTAEGNKYQRVRERKRRGGGTIIQGKTIVMERDGRGRLPISKVTYEWESEGAQAMRRATAKIEERLLVILQQELNYEVQKAIGRAR